MRQVFKLQDYEISVDYGSHVIYRMKTRFYDLNPAELDFVFENIFTDEKVADFLINDVRIGEDVVVIDEDSGISFAVNIGIDCFYVKTLFNGFDGKLLIGDMQMVLRFAKSAGVRIEQFRRQRSGSYA